MDDPFARAAQVPDDAGPPAAPGAGTTPPAPLVQRDPDAAEESSEYRATGAESFDDLLRRARGHGFLLGAATGALGAAAIAAVLALLTAHPAIPVAIAPPAEGRAAAVPEERPHAAEPARALDGAVRRKPPAHPASGVAVLQPLVLDVAEAGSAPLPALADPELPEAPPPSAPVIPAEPPAPGPAADAPPPPAAHARPFPEREVADALRSRSRDVAECVAATPGDRAAARGQRFSLTLVIDPSGRVADAQIDDPQIESTPVGVCLVRVAHEISFAPFEGRPYRVELALGYGEAD